MKLFCVMADQAKEKGKERKEVKKKSLQDRVESYNAWHETIVLASE